MVAQVAILLLQKLLLWAAAAVAVRVIQPVSPEVQAVEDQVTALEAVLLHNPVQRPVAMAIVVALLLLVAMARPLLEVAAVLAKRVRIRRSAGMAVKARISPRGLVTH